MTRAESASLCLLAQAAASTVPIQVGEPADDQLARALARLGLLRLVGDEPAAAGVAPLFCTVTRKGEKALEGIRMLVLDGLGSAIAAERPPEPDRD